MATELIGDTTWTEIPGTTETNGEDGSLTVVRYYNGAITGGTGGSGAVSWQAFKSAYPQGTNDPTYGSNVRSITYPVVTQSNNATYVASITFRGSLFEGEGDEEGESSAPQVSVSQVADTITVDHASIAGQSVRLTFRAWQSVISYVRKGEPSKTGAYKSKADDTAVTLTVESVKQEPLGTTEDDIAQMDTTQLNAAVTANTEPYLEDLSFVRRSADNGTPIYDVTETWKMGLTVA